MKNVLFIILIFISQTLLRGQVANLEITYNGVNLSAPTPSVAPQTATLRNNTAPAIFLPYEPVTTFQVSLSDQQYSNVLNQSGRYGMMFGQTSSTNGNNHAAANLWNTLPLVGPYSNASVTDFTTNHLVTPGTGINSNNFALWLGFSVTPLKNKPTNQRHYYGKVTITFNRPVTNPVLHFGSVGAMLTDLNCSNAGFTSDWELYNAPAGITLSKLSGTQSFSVSGNKIKNANSPIITPGNTSYTMAAGSVLVKGGAVTTLTFKVYLRADPYMTSWVHMGSAAEVVALSASLSETWYKVSGTVRDDVTPADGHVNGAGLANLNGTPLYIYAYNSNGTVVAKTAVNADGSYSLSILKDTQVKLSVSTANVNVGQTAPNTLTGNWQNSGENAGNTQNNGNDGTPNGILDIGTLNGDSNKNDFGLKLCGTIGGTVYNDNDAGTPNGAPMQGTTVTLYAADGITVIATTTTNGSGVYSFNNQVVGNYVMGVTLPFGYQHVGSTDNTPTDGKTAVTLTGTANINGISFGINQPPTVNNDNIAGQAPGSPATVNNILANDTDPNGGTLSPSNVSLTVPAGATGITYGPNGNVTGFTVPGQGTWTLNTANGNLTFTPQAGFTGSPSPVSYTVKDAAGLTGNTGSVSIGFNSPVAVSGKIFNDNDGTTGGVNGTSANMAGITVTLYAANGTTVVATATTAPDGAYGFANVLPGNYVVGVATPAGFFNVSSTDNTPTDGKTNIGVGSAPVPNVGFGINQPPTVNNDNIAGQAPGSPATVNNILANDTDPNGGTLSPSNVSLTVPAGATGITYGPNGNVTGFTVPGQGTWTLNTANGNLTFTPQAGFTGSPSPVSYTVKDAAGLTGNTSTVTITYNNVAVNVAGQIFNDNNGTTGGVNGNSTNMGGITVTLYASNGTTALATATTASDGTYSFTNVAPGNYVVGITPHPGFFNVSSTDNTPTDGKTSITVGLAAVPNVGFGINQPPVANTDALTGQALGYEATVPNILSNDTDPNGGILSTTNLTLVSPPNATAVTTNGSGNITGFTVPGVGTWTLNTSNGNVTFTPLAGFSSDPHPISYVVRDAAGLPSLAGNIFIGFDEPASVSGQIFNDNDGATGGIGGNNADVGGITVTLYAANGTTVVTTAVTDPVGNYIFPSVPPGNYVVGVTTPSGFSNVSSTDNTPTDGKTAITVTGTTDITGTYFGINQPPTANIDVVTGQVPGTPATANNVLANDTDPNGGTLSPSNITLTAPANATGIVAGSNGNITGFTVPGQGTWTLNTTNGNITFTPQAGFASDPTPISYIVKDAAGLPSNTGSVFMGYDDPASVSGQIFNDNNGTTGGIGGNTANTGGITVTLYASNGTTVIATTTTDAVGKYTFPSVLPGSYVVGIAPPSGFFNVSSTDNTPTDGKTAITITGVTDVNGLYFGINQPPTANADAINGQAPGSPATINNVLANDTDANGGTLSPSNVTLEPPANATGITTGTNGNVTGFTVPGQGTWALNTTNGNITFTPQVGFTGDPTPVAYTVRDAAGLPSNTSFVSIDYDVSTTVSGQVFNDNDGTTGGVNGTSANMGGITVTLYAANGTTVVATTTTAPDGAYGFANVLPGNYVVGVATPTGFSHVSSTDNTPTDGKTNISVGAAAVPNVGFGINQPPTANADTISGQAPGSPATVNNILANDTDPNGGTLSPSNVTLEPPANATGITTGANGNVTGFTVPGQGTWALNTTNGNITFTPQNGFTGDPTPIGYTVKDAAGLSSGTKTVSVDFNESPTTVNDQVTVNGGSSATVDVLANDNDPDGTLNPTTVSLVPPSVPGVTTATDAQGDVVSVTVPGQGTWTVNPNNGTVTFTPQAGFNGSPTPIGYTVDDNNGATSGTATITVATNKAPVAVNDVVASDEGIPVIIDVLTNDSDPDGTLNPTTVSLVPPSLPGVTTVTDAEGDVVSVTIPNEGTWTVNPTTGTATFTPTSVFNGNPTPIGYTVDDTNGASSNAATVTIMYHRPNLIPLISFDPTIVFAPQTVGIFFNIYEANNAPTAGPITMRIAKVADLPLNFNPTASTINGIAVVNGSWNFDATSDPNFYILTSTATIAAGTMVSVGFTVSYSPAGQQGQTSISVVIDAGGGGEGASDAIDNSDIESIFYHFNQLKTGASSTSK